MLAYKMLLLYVVVYFSEYIYIDTRRKRKYRVTTRKRGSQLLWE